MVQRTELTGLRKMVTLAGCLIVQTRFLFHHVEDARDARRGGTMKNFDVRANTTNMLICLPMMLFWVWVLISVDEPLIYFSGGFSWGMYVTWGIMVWYAHTTTAAWRADPAGQRESSESDGA